MWNWEKGVKGEFIISKDAKPVIFIVSDSIGETAELVARAAAIQFNHGGVEIRRLSYVNDPNEIPEIMEVAVNSNCVIAYTLVIPELKQVLVREAARYGIPTVDVLTPMMEAVSQLVDRSPKLEPGLVRKMDSEYYRKVEAIEFAVKYDDGKDPRGILRADLVVRLHCACIWQTSKLNLPTCRWFRRYRRRMSSFVSRSIN